MAAPIENLPAELIQPIFELSDFNPSLPLASHHIAARLSVDHIYHSTCSHWLAQPEFHGSRASPSSAQTQIFAAKWMTWAFFKSWITERFRINRCLCGKTADTGCFDAIWPPHFEDATCMIFSRSHLPVFAWARCRIPVKLLQGPWTTDKIEFLRFLLWTSSMTVDWANPTTRRIALEGKKEAIIEQNWQAVELFNHNRRLGKSPGLDQIRFAVLEAGCPRNIVYDLMATARTWGLRGTQWECEVLDKWCAERPDDPKAKWLALKLSELRVVLDDGPAAAGTTDGGRAGPGLDQNFGRMNPRTDNYRGKKSDKLQYENNWDIQDILQRGWQDRTGRYTHDTLFEPRLSIEFMALTIRTGSKAHHRWHTTGDRHQGTFAKRLVAYMQNPEERDGLFSNDPF